MLKVIVHNRFYLLAAIGLISLLMHLHVFNRDLVGVHVWRQTQTQINIENFARHDFNILNTKSLNMNNPDQLLRYEFPLMQWTFACFYKLFGDHIFISRFLTFIIGLFSLWGIYRLLEILFRDKRVTAAGTWAFCFSPVFYYYTVNPLPDNLALCAAIWSLFHFFAFAEQEKKKHFLLSALFLLLATLCKLPFILYGTPWLVWFIRNIRSETGTALKKGSILLVLILPAIAWYIWVIPGWNGNGIVSGMLETKSSWTDTLYILQSNLISTLPELLVNYGALVFFAAGLFLVFKRRLYRSYRGSYLAWLGIAVLFYFFFEMNMIGTVHDYYLFPFLPLLFILVTFGIQELWKNPTRWVRTFTFICLAILPLTAFIRINQRWNTKEPGFNPDLLTYKKEIRSCMRPGAICIVGNDNSAHIWPYYVDRRSWNFYGDYLSEEYLNRARNSGAKYLVSDSRVAEQIPYVHASIKGLVLAKGTIRVYELN